MTRLFQQLVDRAASHILQAQAQQKHYANKHRKDARFAVGDKLDKPRPPHMLQPTGWRPAEEPRDDCDPVYEVERILDTRGSSADEEFLGQWRGYPVEQATWEPLSISPTAVLF
ncbi:hypothetical protein Emed_007569 [Eimeria media]